jgi:biopolymer transport protein ExbB/TolQ
MWGELALSVQHANGYVMAILALGFLAGVIFFERLIMLQFVYNIDFGKFLGNLRKMVLAEDLDRAITLCKNVSHTSLPRISQRALEAAETDPTKVRGTIEEETIEFLPNLERRLGALPAFCVLIMLLGILGTIDALWVSFRAIDVLDTAKKQATLAQGIAGSLNPTALGLLFGMFLLAGYYLLRGMSVNLTERMHHGVAVLSNLLVPAEVATYVPMASDGGGGGAPARAAVADPGESSEPKAEAASGADESFDDVSVEDIKDEEEII